MALSCSGRPTTSKQSRSYFQNIANDSHCKILYTELTSFIIFLQENVLLKNSKVTHRTKLFRICCSVIFTLILGSLSHSEVSFLRPMHKSLRNHNILSEPSLPACDPLPSPCVDMVVTSISCWLSTSSKGSSGSQTNRACLLKSQRYVYPSAGECALLESDFKTAPNSVGIMGRGVPPQLA